MLNRLFILIIFLLSSNFSHADWIYTGTSYTSPTALCKAVSDKQGYTNVSNYSFNADNGVTCYLTRKDDNSSAGGYGPYAYSAPATCEQKYDSGMFWGATSAPSTFCDGQCEWKVEKSSCGADYNQDGTFTGASSCAYDAQTNGNTCSTNTGTPQNPTPTPPPPNSPCGPGKTQGVINGTTICVNNSAPPPNCQKLPNGNYNCVPKDPNDPNDPNNPPNDPNNPPTGGGSGCTSNCNNTTNNNTTINTTNNNTTNNTSITNNTTEAPAVDLSPVIDKLNQVDTGIKAVDTAIKSVGTGIKAVETAINTTSQTITNAINVVKDKVTEVKNSVDQAKEQAKTDAAAQKAATDAAKEQAKTDAKTQFDETKKHGDQAKTDAKTQVDETKKHGEQAKTDAAAQKAATEAQTKQDKDFYDWAKDESGIPANAPDGKINTGTGALTEYNMTGQEMDGNYINFGGSCPADVSIPINVGQGHGNITMSWKPMCDLAPMLRAVFIAMAYFSGAFIVLGVGKPTNSGA